MANCEADVFAFAVPAQQGSGLVTFPLILIAYVALSTPGPPPLPVPFGIAAAVIGLAMVSLAVARAAGRRGP